MFKPVLCLQDAMFIVLDELKEGDRFNIITFCHDVKTYKPDMIDVTQREVLDAKTFTKRITVNGCMFVCLFDCSTNLLTHPFSMYPSMYD
jgi:hypothetical protein